ncbi:MAG: hypothetical protein Q7I99_03810 [Acholeplasmataceae bacterium]|nr:hypothetical protein [Acholeplasmataceae bacterium]
MYKYFVAIETEFLGYIVGAFEEYDEAQICFEKSAIFIDITEFSLKQYFKDYRTYKLNNDPFVYKFDDMISAGYLSVYMFMIGKHWKSVEHFIADREFKPTFLLGADMRN